MSSLVAIPEVIVELDGGRLDPGAMAGLAHVRVQQRLSAPAQCELTFDLPADVDVAAPGAELRLGIAGRDTPLFSGQLTAVEHVFGPDRGYQLHVRAYDPLHRLRKSQRARALAQTTVESLAGELMSELGLSVQAAASGPLWQNLVQHRESDLELLVVAAERCGLYPVVREDVLHLLTLEGTGDAIELTLGEHLLEAHVELNGDRSCRSVTAAGWNTLTNLVPPYRLAGFPSAGSRRRE